MQLVREKFYMTEHNITTGGELNRDSAEHDWEQFYLHLYLLIKLNLFHFDLTFFGTLTFMCVCAYATGFLQTFTLKYNKTLKWINLYLKWVLRGTA